MALSLSWWPRSGSGPTPRRLHRVATLTRPEQRCSPLPAARLIWGADKLTRDGDPSELSRTALELEYLPRRRSRVRPPAPAQLISLREDIWTTVRPSFPAHRSTPARAPGPTGPRRLRVLSTCKGQAARSGRRVPGGAEAGGGGPAIERFRAGIRARSYPRLLILGAPGSPGVTTTVPRRWPGVCPVKRLRWHYPGVSVCLVKCLVVIHGRRAVSLQNHAVVHGYLALRQLASVICPRSLRC
jgi:hypothetical protein